MTTHDSPKPMDLVMTAGATVAGAAFVGASTNAINGVVSPHYFRQIMQWEGVADIWKAAIAQGIFEGLIVGMLAAFVFTLVVGIASRARCPFQTALWHLIPMIGGVYCCWIAGGLIAMGLATLSPEFYVRTFIGVPEQYVPRLCYAWVGGSIWGAQFGGLIAVTIGSIVFANNWQLIAKSTDGA